MVPLFFGVKGRPVALATSFGRRITVYRTELDLELWDGNRFDRTPRVALWDTGADFLTLSEAVADQWGVEWRSGTEYLGTGGVGGSFAGVLVPLVFRLVRLRSAPFRVECQVVPGTDFIQPLLGNHFVRRNFSVLARGERRTYFTLRDPAPDAVAAAQLRGG